MNSIWLYIRSLRVKQWVKNLFIFAPVVFARQFESLDVLVKTTTAFLLFSLLTGAIYVFNDILDREADRLHPRKKNRPIASGKLNPAGALAAAGLQISAVLTAGLFLDSGFFIISLAYLSLNVMYSLFLKRIAILDVMLIATGFVMRVLIGGVINQIEISPWIIIITFLLSLFLGLVKRRQELSRLVESGGSGGDATRQSLKRYSMALLDQLIPVVTATTLISYIMYVINPGIQSKFHTGNLYYTIPFVLFGIFRYLYLTYQCDKGESPEEIIFSDLPFSINLLLWLGVFILLISV